jgi:pyruvate formate lyase activating enzyme
MESVITSQAAEHPPARWWHPLDDGKVVCTLCPRECHIPLNSRGFCFVRANVDGKLDLTTYGRSTGFCIDPIEKKPLNHFLPGTPVLSFGTAGCNLGCKFCQNWDISKSRQVERLSAVASPDAIVQAAVESGCRSIAFTYNDPVIWAEYAIDVARVAREHNIKTVAVTAGYISPEPRREFYQWMDAANVDLKAFTDTFYRKLTQTELQPVLDTLIYLKHHTSVWFEITTLVIPGENDSPEEIAAMCDWIMRELGPDVPLHFTAFHPEFKMLDTPRTSHETLIRCRQQALDAGLHYVYVGNVNDVERQSTRCHVCGHLLIERNWHALGRWGLRDGRCEKCAALLPGVLEAQPGNWGRKRQPVTIHAEGPNLVTMTSTMAKKKTPARPATKPAASKPAAAKPVATKPAATKAAASKPAPVKAPAAKAVPVKSSSVKPTPAKAPAATKPTSAVAAAGDTTLTASAAASATTPEARSSAAAASISFTPEQDRALLEYARAVVVATVLRKPAPPPLPSPLAQRPVYGMFVSLERPTLLRSCRGRWNAPDAGQAAPLGALLAAVAADAATLDPRFPSIHAAELPLLSVSISLMFDPQPITAVGDMRVESVVIGTHGLMINHPSGRGLLLPHVAVEAKADARVFLEMLCRKAGIPAKAWADAAATLTTFRARKIDLTAARPEIDLQALGGNGLFKLFVAANASVQGQQLPVDEPLLVLKHAEDLGMTVVTQSGVTGAAIGPSHSLHSLMTLSVRAAQNIHAQRKLPLTGLSQMTLLWQPMHLLAQDYPRRHAGLSNKAVLVQQQSKWTLVIPKPAGKPDKVAEALGNLGLTVDQWRSDSAGTIRVTAFSVVHCRSNSATASMPQQQSQPQKQQQPQTAMLSTTRLAAGATSGFVAPDAASATFIDVRPAAKAGAFYPATPQAIAQEAEAILSQGTAHAGGRQPQNYRAVMLPHAGWRFCGVTLGRTLARVKVPSTVICLGPKHTPHGPAWSVASQTHWDVPGARVPIDTELSQRLASVTGMRREPEAHRAEHGTEVLLPLLHKLQPALRVVPVVLGRCTFEQTLPLAQALAQVLRDADIAGRERPLLVISSDMNHFAAGPENRRLDALALAALASGDPQKLFDVCTANNISMCGLIPAVVVMRALLLARSTKLAPEVVDYSDSAAVTGDQSRVVGYAGALLA